MSAELVRPTQNAIKDYYETLRRHARQKVAYESAPQVALLNLLAETAKLCRRDVIAEVPLPIC